MKEIMRAKIIHNLKIIEPDEDDYGLRELISVYIRCYGMVKLCWTFWFVLRVGVRVRVHFL